MCVYICKYTHIYTNTKNRNTHTHLPVTTHLKQDTKHSHPPPISLLPLSGQPLTHQPSKRQFLSDFYHHGLSCSLLY